jgi:hypothetical protein
MAAFSWGGVGMKSGKFLTFGIVALLLPGMTMAQMAPPSTMMDGMAARLPSDPTKVTTSDAMHIMDRHSACLVSMHADMADMAIGPFPKRSRAARALSQPGIESCLQSSKAGKHVRMATNFELLRDRFTRPSIASGTALPSPFLPAWRRIGYRSRPA